eukprot:m.215114 g.215114  ORF g.215114 m.215114 type:complete len:292 (-) comp27600_c0_seq1:201-1076(-)
MGQSDKTQLSREGYKIGKVVGRFPFRTIECNKSTKELTLGCEVGLINRVNTPSKPVCYSAEDVCVLKTVGYRPYVVFTLPAKVFFDEFQPWYTKQMGAPVPHEYETGDEPIPTSPGIQLDESSPPSPIGSMSVMLKLPQSGVDCKSGKPFTHVTFWPETQTITLGDDDTAAFKSTKPFTPEFFTTQSEVTIYRSIKGAAPSPWFTLLPKVFFTEFQPWLADTLGEALPDKAVLDGNRSRRTSFDASAVLAFLSPSRNASRSSSPVPFQVAAKAHSSPDVFDDDGEDSEETY